MKKHLSALLAALLLSPALSAQAEKVALSKVSDAINPAMAGPAETARERRARIINAEAEFQAAEKLVQTAAMISGQAIALQLRFIQTTKEISGEQHNHLPAAAHGTVHALPEGHRLERIARMITTTVFNTKPYDREHLLWAPGTGRTGIQCFNRIDL